MLSYDPKLSPAAPLPARTSASREEAGPGATRLSSGAGLALVAGAFAALLAARYTLFDLIVLVTDHRPSESLVLGTVFVVTAFVAMALAERHYPNMPDPKRGVLVSARAPSREAHHRGMQGTEVPKCHCE